MDGRLLLSGIVALALMVHLVRFGLTAVFLIVTGVFCVLLYESNRARVSERGSARAAERANELLRRLVREDLRLRYVFVDERVPRELTGMRHVRRFVKSSFEEYVRIVERFMKVYYNVLAGRFHRPSHLDIMKDLHLELEDLFEQFLISTPRYSSRIFRSGSRSLHEVLRAHHGRLVRIIHSKIRRVANQTKKRAAI